MAEFDVTVRQTPHIFSDSPGIWCKWDKNWHSKPKEDDVDMEIFSCTEIDNDDVTSTGLVSCKTFKVECVKFRCLILSTE